ncbi:MAG: RNA-binding S4 domain-containing protein [Anderseniella sp.]|jgi:ribosome-associated heat shock protein Hsp15|nr:RNA-binding S4 domain-containing protein [Anderseniella sp.]
MTFEDPQTAAACQRIDKWLWFARLVKTRGLAQRLVAAGNVRVNRNRLTKSSQTVAPGDVVSVLVHDHIRVIRVEQPGHRRGPAPEARLLYTELTPRSGPPASEPAPPAGTDDLSA